MEEQERQEKQVEAMAARIFERMIAMSHSDLCIRVQYFDAMNGGPNPLEVAEYARMAARCFYSRLAPGQNDPARSEETAP